METTTPDFRALCKELVEALDECQRPYGDQPESALVWKARAALAEQPVGPTESDVTELFYRHVGEGSEVGFENAIAEALALWGAAK